MPIAKWSSIRCRWGGSIRRSVLFGRVRARRVCVWPQKAQDFAGGDRRGARWALFIEIRVLPCNADELADWMGAMQGELDRVVNGFIGNKCGALHGIWIRAIVNLPNGKKTSQRAERTNQPCSHHQRTGFSMTMLLLLAMSMRSALTPQLEALLKLLPLDPNVQDACREPQLCRLSCH